MERSFFLKKRRADFVAGSVSGRVIVAGGLGKGRASGPALWSWGSVGSWHAAGAGEDAGSFLPLPTALFHSLQSTLFLPAGCHVSVYRAHMGSGGPFIQGKLRPRKQKGHTDNQVTQAG